MILRSSLHPILSSSFLCLLYLALKGPPVCRKNNQTHPDPEVGYQPSVLISDFVKEIKLATHAYILTNRIVRGSFAWQSGYGVFSYSHSQIDRVINYIKNQEIHHKKKTFQEEYAELLEQFAIEYDSRYIFSPID